MLKMILLLTITVAAMAATGELKRVALTRSDGALRATTKNGEILLEAREMLVDVTYTSGMAAKGYLLVLRDKSSRLFLWKYWRVSKNDTPRVTMLDDFLAHSLAYQTDDRLVVFSDSPPRLFVRESFSHADSLDEAETKALREATDELDYDAEKRGTLGSKQWRTVSLLKLTMDFFLPKNSAGPSKAKLIGVSRRDGNWEILIEGQWKEKVVLNDKYEIIDMERIE